jgi:hypothetical protein
MYKLQQILFSTIITLTYLGSVVAMDQEKERTQKEINAEKMWIYKEELDRHNLDLKRAFYGTLVWTFTKHPKRIFSQ